MDRNKGFTLVELMIVMAVISILCGIAVPNYVKYRIRAYQCEAKVILASIASNQMRHKLQTGVFVTCPPNPSSPGKQWDSRMSEWNRIGFSMNGKFYYQYEVISDETGFVAYAHGLPNLDEWEISSENLTPVCTSCKK